MTMHDPWSHAMTIPVPTYRYLIEASAVTTKEKRVRTWDSASLSYQIEVNYFYRELTSYHISFCMR